MVKVELLLLPTFLDNFQKFLVLKTIRNKRGLAVTATHFLAILCKQLFFLIKSFLGINLIPRIYLRKAVYKECARKWVAITVGTLLFCFYFSQKLAKISEPDAIYICVNPKAYSAAPM